MINEQELSPILEAKDITREAKQAAATLSTGSQKAGIQKAGSTDLNTNTNDILGTKGTPNPNAAPPQQGGSTPPPDDRGDNAPPPDDTGGDDTPPEDGNLDDTTDPDADNPDQPEAPKETSATTVDAKRKNRLFANMTLFYKNLETNLDLLSNYTTSIAADGDGKAIYSVIDNLTQCKDSLYDMLMNEAGNIPYVNILRRYVTITKVYDICLEMLREHLHLREGQLGELESKKRTEHKEKEDKPEPLSRVSKKGSKETEGDSKGKKKKKDDSEEESDDEEDTSKEKKKKPSKKKTSVDFLKKTKTAKRKAKGIPEEEA